MKKSVFVKDYLSWERVLHECNGKSEIIIFKFSPVCGTSYQCEKMFDEWFGKIPEDANITAVKIDVIASRSLSRRIAEDFEIKHESPQIIWLNKQKAVKAHKSHFLIKEEVLSELLTQG